MGHVFISHASADSDVANQVSEALEAQGLTTWIAPRDVPTGMSYPSAILGAIRSCSAAVLVLTSESNRSPHVTREIERVAASGAPILVLRVDPTPLNDELEYFVSLNQWLDASVGSLDQHLGQLCRRVLELTEVGPVNEHSPSATSRGRLQTRNDSTSSRRSTNHSLVADSRGRSEVSQERLRPANNFQAVIDFSELASRQRQLLTEFGKAVLDLICRRPDPADPISRRELLAELTVTHGPMFGGVSFRQFSALLEDAKSNGCAPGLSESTAGLFVVEENIAIKLERNKSLKESLAGYAVNLVKSGDVLAMDGGSTTLPIAEGLCARLEEDSLNELCVITNSLAIAQRFSLLMADQGWTDENCPVQLYLAGGMVRANTHATAWGFGKLADTQDLDGQLFGKASGIDICFLGANGFTSGSGLTMAATQELQFKRTAMQSSTTPYFVADSSKFGIALPIVIADWTDSFTLLTNPLEQAGYEDLYALVEQGRVYEVSG